MVTGDSNQRPLERDRQTDGRTLINCEGLTNYVEVRNKNLLAIPAPLIGGIGPEADIAYNKGV